jgi:hypothetical protein
MTAEVLEGSSSSNGGDSLYSKSLGARLGGVGVLKVVGSSLTDEELDGNSIVPPSSLLLDCSKKGYAVATAPIPKKTTNQSSDDGNNNNHHKDDPMNSSSFSSSLVSGITMEQELLSSAPEEEPVGGGPGTEPGLTGQDRSTARFVAPTMAEDGVGEPPSRASQTDVVSRDSISLTTGVPVASSSSAVQRSSFLLTIGDEDPGNSGTGRRRSGMRGIRTSASSDENDASFTFGGSTPVSRCGSSSASGLASSVDNLEVSLDHLTLTGGTKRESLAPAAAVAAGGAARAAAVTASDHPQQNGAFLPVLMTYAEADAASGGASSPASAGIDHDDEGEDVDWSSVGRRRRRRLRRRRGAPGRPNDQHGGGDSSLSSKAATMASSSSSTSTLMLSSITMDSALLQQSYSRRRSSQSQSCTGLHEMVEDEDTGGDNDVHGDSRPPPVRHPGWNNKDTSNDAVVASFTDSASPPRRANSWSSSCSSFFKPPTDSEIRFDSGHSPYSRVGGRSLHVHPPPSGRPSVHEDIGNDGHDNDRTQDPTQQEPLGGCAADATFRSPIDPPPHPPQRLSSNSGLQGLLDPATAAPTPAARSYPDINRRHHKSSNQKTTFSPITPTTLTSHTSLGTTALARLACPSSLTAPPIIPTRRGSTSTATCAGLSVDADTADVSESDCDDDDDDDGQGGIDGSDESSSHHANAAAQAQLVPLRGSLMSQMLVPSDLSSSGNSEVLLSPSLPSNTKPALEKSNTAILSSSAPSLPVRQSSINSSRSEGIAGQKQQQK